MANKAIKLMLAMIGMLMASQSAVFAEEFFGRVVGVSDGDTITVLADGVPRKIRLSGIDCPEKSQAYGQQAKAFTAEHSFARDVKIIALGHDKYRRTIGEVILPDGENLNDLLLANGYAWWYQRFSHDEARHELEERARQLKLGLWSDPQPAAPWDYRKAAKAIR
jgi:endonuclease YncB( thermonuclease family)